MQPTPFECAELLAIGVQLFASYGHSAGGIACRKGVAPSPQLYFKGAPKHAPKKHDAASSVYRAAYEWPGVIRVYAGAQLIAETGLIKTLPAVR